MTERPNDRLGKIPFDSFTLAAVVEELRPYVGGKVQNVRQPSDTEVAFGLYANGREAMLLLSCHPLFARAHLITKRPGNQPSPPQFLSALRSRIDGGRLVEVRQIQGDRILEITVETPLGVFRLVAELMGKHSNLVLVEEDGRVVGAAKWVGRSKSSRPIQPATPYVLPPVMSGGEEIKSSPFLRRLTEALGHPPLPNHPVFSPGHGAYPASVAALGFTEHARASISIALENHFDQAIPAHEVDTLKHTLVGQLERVIFARDTALGDLRKAEAAGGKAPEWQRLGELILAYGPSAPPGAKTLAVWDYDGTEREVKLDPELDFRANANRLFDRAKRAKGRMGLVRDQIERLSADRENIAALLGRIQTATRLDALRDLQEEANRRRYLNTQVVVARNKEDRPYEGHRIRELVGPGGYTILYGETAEANDYLTLRVAKSNDWWLHIRGSASAHVVIATRNQPDRVQRETIEYAAKIAVQHSPSKHAGYVPVDYTLKKYVRKPKGAPKGTALYTHEKTLHIES
jgi:predicted ribosome quality control (RQC) complex YloA/Tae2 family protein